MELKVLLEHPWIDTQTYLHEVGTKLSDEICIVDMLMILHMDSDELSKTRSIDRNEMILLQEWKSFCLELPIVEKRRMVNILNRARINHELETVGQLRTVNVEELTARKFFGKKRETYKLMWNIFKR